MLPKKKKPPQKDRREVRQEFLSLRPLRNPDLPWEEKEGRVVLTIPRPQTKQVKIINIFFPVPDSRQVILDPIGSHVWKQCDGQTPMKSIAQSLQSTYQLGAREAELSLRQFFQEIGKRGYVGFAIEKKEAAQPENSKGADTEK